MDTVWDVYLTVKDHDGNEVLRDCHWGCFDTYQDALDFLDTGLDKEDIPWLNSMHSKGMATTMIAEVYEKPSVLVHVKHIDGEDA